MIDRPHQVAGVVLAGGQSRRMGGGDKALRLLAGRPMLDHVLGALQPQVCAVAINANGDPARFSDYGLPVIADTVEGYVGPLAGILAGLRWASRLDKAVTHVATVSSDAPLIPSDLVARLSATLEHRPEAIALARSAGEWHPVIGLWPVSLADELERDLRRGARKVLDWAMPSMAIGVDFAMHRIADRDIDPFFNANTPEDFEALRAVLEHRGGA